MMILLKMEQGGGWQTSHIGLVQKFITIPPASRIIGGPMITVIGQLTLFWMTPMMVLLKGVVVNYLVETMQVIKKVGVILQAWTSLRSTEITAVMCK